MMQIDTRQAGNEDAEYLAGVMYDSMLPGAGRGVFDVALEGTGTNSLQFHEAMLLTGASNWGQIESFFILEVEGKRAGAMGAFLSSMSDRRPLTAEGFARVSEYLQWEPSVARAFWNKYVAFFGLFGNAPQLEQPAEYVLEYAAVDSMLRGRGLYGRLLAAHAERAKERGYKTMGGTAIAGNESVLRAMHKFGFHDHAHFGPEFYNGQFPGLTRLVYEVS